MSDHGILAPILPELVPDPAAKVAALAAAEKAAAICADPLRRLAAMLPRDPVVAAKVAARLKLSKKARQRLAEAADPNLDTAAQTLAYHHGTKAGIDRLLLAGRPQDAASIDGWHIPLFPLTGGALIARGVPPGPSVARLLREIERKWVAAGFPGGGLFNAIIDETLAGAASA
jgi:poly(A) polymerase